MKWKFYQTIFIKQSNCFLLFVSKTLPISYQYGYPTWYYFSHLDLMCFQSVPLISLGKYVLSQDLNMCLQLFRVDTKPYPSQTSICPTCSVSCLMSPLSRRNTCQKSESEWLALFNKKGSGFMLSPSSILPFGQWVVSLDESWERLFYKNQDRHFFKLSNKGNDCTRTKTVVAFMHAQSSN